jgi:hypothetical protein
MVNCLVALHEQVDVNDVENLVKVGSTGVFASGGLQNAGHMLLPSDFAESSSGAIELSLDFSDFLRRAVAASQLNQVLLVVVDSSLIVALLDVVSVQKDGLLDSERLDLLE